MLLEMQMMGRNSRRISNTGTPSLADSDGLQQPLRTNVPGFESIGSEDKDVDASGQHENQPDERTVLFAIMVEIEDGRTELISMREGDMAEEVAAKFCRDHCLSDRFVSPLTEHIVNNIKDISNEDNSASGLLPSPAIEEVRGAKPKKFHSGSKGHQGPSGPTMLQKHNDNPELWQGNQPRICDHRICSLRSSHEQQTQKVQKRKPSNHHLFPSFASLAKTQNKEPPVEQIKQPHRTQLSKKAKAVYMRLYVEFLRHKQKLEEEKKECIEQYFERLEREKPMYSKKTKRIMLMRGRAAKQFKNYGELLYHEALNKEEEKKKISEKKKIEDQENELKAVTAKPEISKLAKQLTRSDEKFWERLSNDRPRLHLQELRHESMEMKFMECTFRPQINRSLHDDQDTTAENVSRFDQLFWDAENRRRRQAEYMQWYPEGVTFRPLINKHMQSGNGNGGKPRKRSVFDRLLQYAAKMTEKKQKMQQSEAKLLDPATGQELFRPQTGRRPSMERNAGALPIGDFLYHLKFTLDSKRCSLAEKNLQHAKELASCHYVSHKSSQLLEHLKERSLQQIFDYLDSDKDGYVELNTADMKELSDEVVEDIEDVKKLGSVSEKRLSFDKFVALMLSIQKKKKRGVHSVMNPCRKHPQPENFPFQFKMDGYSRCLASSRRSFGNSQQWYRMILSDRERREAKIEAMRKDKENQELAECTFTPALHGNSCKGPARLIHGNRTNSSLPLQSMVVEKELQEMHGFIFQDNGVQGPDLSITADTFSPLSLIQSLKRMVSKSAEQQGERPPTNELRRNDFYLSGVAEG